MDEYDIRTYMPTCGTVERYALFDLPGHAPIPTRISCVPLMAFIVGGMFLGTQASCLVCTEHHKPHPQHGVLFVLPPVWYH